jgi:hypothetical protein
MNDEEKQIIKDMAKLILNMTLQKTALMAILQMHVPNWPSVLASLISSPAHQTLLKENEKLLRNINSLIDENKLTVLRSKFPKGDQLN